MRSRLPAAAALLVLASGGFPAAIAAGDELPDPVRVAAPEEGARQPSVAVDEKGGVHVAFVSGTDVRIASSAPGAESFGEARLVAAAPGIACGMRRGPRLVACEGVLLAAWIAPPPPSAEGKKPGPDLFASRSTDGGATWSPPARVNKDPGVCGEGLHALAAGRAKTVYAVWLQPIKKGKPGMGVRLARSDDAGVTWALETWVYDPPSGTVCECCHPTVAVSGEGTVAVMFRNSLDGARDMYVVESKDRGKKFGPARKLGSGTWKLATCPMDGGGATYGSDGELFTVWRRGGSVHIVRGSGGEQSVGEGSQPWVGGVPGGKCWAIWVESRGGVSVRCHPDPEGGALGLPGAKCVDPVMAGSESGTVFGAWEVVRENGKPPSIYGVFFARPAAPK